MAERGRPTLYKPEYCDAVVAHMAGGFSLTSFAASVGVCRETVSEWCRVHPDFSVAAKRGKAVCAAWWERVNANLAQTGQGNATACVFGLKNMAADDWRDKHEHALSGAVETTAKVDWANAPADALRALAALPILKETN
jgi:hypothetical protein